MNEWDWLIKEKQSQSMIFSTDSTLSRSERSWRISSSFSKMRSSNFLMILSLNVTSCWSSSSNCFCLSGPDIFLLLLVCTAWAPFSDPSQPSGTRTLDLRWVEISNNFRARESLYICIYIQMAPHKTYPRTRSTHIIHTHSFKSRRIIASWLR